MKKGFELAMKQRSLTVTPTIICFTVMMFWKNTLSFIS